MYQRTNELAHGNIIPRENVPKVGLISAPIKETAAGKMSPIC